MRDAAVPMIRVRLKDQPADLVAHAGVQADGTAGADDHIADPHRRRMNGGPWMDPCAQDVDGIGWATDSSFKRGEET